MADPIVVVVPVRIVSVANLREHWARRASRTKTHRETTAWALSAHDKPEGPVVVTLTRIAPRPLDGHDNLRSALKAVVDAVAQWLGLDDADPLVTWAYAQRRGMPHEYAAEVRIEVVA